MKILIQIFPLQFFPGLFDYRPVVSRIGNRFLRRPNCCRPIMKALDILRDLDQRDHWSDKSLCRYNMTTSQYTLR